MLTFATGDMFEIDADVLVNTVNCVGVMGCGVALAFKKRYKDMFSVYRKICKEGTLEPGGVWKYRVCSETDEKIILNLATKDHWRNASKYKYVENGLKNLRNHLLKLPPGTKVAVPALGCGHGGLFWDVVSSLIKRYLGDLDNVDIYVFSPQNSRGLDLC